MEKLFNEKGRVNVGRVLALQTAFYVTAPIAVIVATVVWAIPMGILWALVNG